MKSWIRCLSPGDRVYDNYSMVKEISGSQGYDGGAQDAEVYAARYCKERYKNQCDIIVKIVRNDQYEGRFFNLFIFTKYYLINFIM